MLEFIRLFAPHLTPEVVTRGIAARSEEERARLLADLEPELINR
jgi:LysR family cys regulon transcriptional activator